MEFPVGYPDQWILYNDSNLAGIQEFLKRGVDPNYQVSKGFTVFHEAICNPFDNIGVVRELINAGADINCRTHLDFTPLHYAVLYRKRLVIDALIQSGASVHAKDFLGATILHHAVTRWEFHMRTGPFVFHRDMWVIDKLLKLESIDCNQVDSNGNTPLNLAVKDQRLDIVVKFLGNKANPNICNNDLETPLHVALAQPLGYIPIKLLLSGANIYSVNKIGQTPLDILMNIMNNDIDSQTNEWVMLVLKIIAFKYSVTSELKRKIELIPHLSRFFNKCCDEVDHMRSDFISGNLTVHDFVWKCFDDNDFKTLLLEIHKPLVERIVRDVYSEYFIEILDMIPEFSLLTILQMTARSKRHAKTKGKMKNLADLFSILDIVYSFSKYLWNVDIFCLIVAFSDVIVANSKGNLYESYIFHIFD
ncbi:hypothetical protein AVEN_204271-1 [Araneus ventricosus]|uniref:Uncharacterized protein n=1 Tax=Araneus ventricosus TaxID=182803 RepID=A0A4Y2JPJ4_ARAVE|nr:hypothetical protein AVEN_204271-1 [Araneus ventricosus]